MISSGISNQNRWGTSTDRSASRPESPLQVAVIGAGLSGLACARLLSEAGTRVRVFDKARGPGGRMATRRQGDLRFDHGAQYFTVRDPSFRRALEQWQADGLAGALAGDARGGRER